MRYARIMMLLVFLLAACRGGGNNQDTPPTDNPNLNVRPTEVLSEEEAMTYEPAEEQSFQEQIDSFLDNPVDPQPFPTAPPLGEGALPVPLPGTLIASETEEASIPAGFDYIYLEQTGGEEGTMLIIEVYSDGTARVDNGELRPIDPQIVNQLGQMIDEMNFFGLQGTFLGPAPSETAYRYRVAVESGEWARAIQAQEGFMPEQFIRFLSTIRSAGDQVMQIGG